MDEKRRFNRAHWVGKAPEQGAAPTGNPPAPLAGFAGANNTQTGQPAAGNPSTSMGMFPAESGTGASSRDLAPGAFSQSDFPQPGFSPADPPRPGFPQPGFSPPAFARSAFSQPGKGEDGMGQDLRGHELGGAEMYGVMDDGAMEGESGFFAEEEQPAEEEQHPLRDALFILVALYVICCIAPLFVGLFAPLRVFFWLEVAGWIIILSWLIFGVRAPFLVWLKERKKGRQEYASESLVKEFADEF